MSYILDALKKSDQQRQQGAGPNLQTIHRPTLSNTDSPLLKLILFVLLLLLVALAAATGWYFFSSQEAVQANSEQVSQQIPIQSTAQTTTINNLAQSKIESVTVPAPPTLNSSAIRFNDLDANTRTAIPGLTFSFHVYSDNPSMRTIIINNRRVKEGELVEKDLLLEEITAQGVVLIWQNRVRFSIDVVESW